MNDQVSRVVVQFHEPLHFKPGEQAHMHETAREEMASVPF